MLHLCTQSTADQVALCRYTELTQVIYQLLHRTIRLVTQRRQIDICLRRLRERRVDSFHYHNQTLQTAAKAHARCCLTAQLGNQTVIPAAAANRALRADIGGNELKDRLGIVVQTANDVGVNFIRNAHIVQIGLYFFKMLTAVITQIIQRNRRVCCDLLAGFLLAVENTHRVAIQTVQAVLTQTVLVLVEIAPEHVIVLRAAVRAADGVDAQRDTLDACRVATHDAHVRLVKADGKAVLGRKQDVVFAVRLHDGN